MRLLACAAVLALVVVSIPVRSQGLPAASRLDFNGDGHTDILWQDIDGGWVAAWLMNGTELIESVLVSTTPRPVVPAGFFYRVGATADLTGDGFEDIIFEHSADHTLSAWLLDATGLAGPAPDLPGTFNNLTYLRTAGDMDRDGSVDLAFWFTPIGAVGIQRSGQTTPEWILEPGTPYTQTVQDRNWQVVGSGDFNGDGSRDILWWHNTGWVAVWLMDRLTLLASVMVVPYQIHPDWRVAGAGDFNADGKPDILWQSTSTGRVAVWLMRDMVLTDSVLVGSPNIPANWRVVGPR